MEVCDSGVFGAICDIGWNKDAAHAICNLVGYKDRGIANINKIILHIIIHYFYSWSAYLRISLWHLSGSHSVPECFL